MDMGSCCHLFLFCLYLHLYLMYGLFIIFAASPLGWYCCCLETTRYNRAVASATQYYQHVANRFFSI